MSGREYDRSQQYTNGIIWQTPGKDDWFWSGNFKRGSMVGEVWRNVDMGWHYAEKRYNNYGQLEYQMISLCHFPNDGARGD